MTDWFSISHRGEESVIFGQLHCRSLKHIKPKRYSEKYMSWSCPTWLRVNGCARCETWMPTISHDLWECSWVKFQRLTVLCAQDIFRRVQRVWFIPIQLLLLEPEMCMDKLVPKAWCERESSTCICRAKCVVERPRVSWGPTSSSTESSKPETQIKLNVLARQIVV